MSSTKQNARVRSVSALALQDGRPSIPRCCTSDEGLTSLIRLLRSQLADATHPISGRPPQLCRSQRPHARDNSQPTPASNRAPYRSAHRGRTLDALGRTPTSVATSAALPHQEAPLFRLFRANVLRAACNAARSSGAGTVPKYSPLARGRMTSDHALSRRVKPSLATGSMLSRTDRPGLSALGPVTAAPVIHHRVG
jgi:hypothetical protein